MNLSSLLLDDHLVIDSSTLETYATCPTKFLNSALRKRVLNSSRAALDFGSAVHAALEERYKNGCGEAGVDVLDRMLAAGNKVLDEASIPFSDYRNKTYLEKLLKSYNAEVGVEPFDIALDANGEPIIERPFAELLGDVEHSNPNLPNPLPIIWTGRTDLIVKWHDGSLSTMDHKTSSMGGEGYMTEYKNNQPQLGYLYVARQHIDPSINTFIINALICRKPLANGGVNFEFKRNRFFVDVDKIAEWKESVLSTIKHIILCDQLGEYPMTMKSCVGKYGACEYLDVCTIPREGRLNALNSNMFRNNTWTPLR